MGNITLDEQRILREIWLERLNGLVIPSFSGQSGMVLGTDGLAISWVAGGSGGGGVGGGFVFDFGTITDPGDGVLNIDCGGIA